MEIRWYACSKCNEVWSYEIHGDYTTFPRGEFLVHRDYFVSGFKTEAEAQKWLKENPLKKDGE